jgi:dsDNA-specific endonuclease/ATPase MutS2
MADVPDVNENGLVRVPIDGVLDLHNFSPKDLKYLIPDYLEECYSAKIFQVRIIHGKGTGTLRRTVHAILKKQPYVKDFRLAGGNAGGWGATLVELRQKK